MQADSKCAECGGELVRFARSTTRNKHREPLVCFECALAHREGKTFDFFDLGNTDSKSTSSGLRNKGALRRGSSTKEFEHEGKFCKCGQRMKRGQSSWCDLSQIPYWRCSKCEAYFADGTFRTKVPSEIRRRYQNEVSKKKAKSKVVLKTKKQKSKSSKSKQKTSYPPAEQNLNPVSVEMESSGECRFWGCTKEGYVCFDRYCQEHHIQEQQTGS